jgi:hypothetical protein
MSKGAFEFGNDDWVVRALVVGPEPWYGVLSPTRDFTDNLDACRKCVQQAIDGNPDAVAAILLCVDDTQLQDEVKRMTK